MIKLFAIFVISLTGLVSNAQSFCQDKAEVIGNTNIQQSQFSDGTCFITAHYFGDFNLVYRSFSWNTVGQLMVFNSYDEQETNRSHGARVFQLFPRNSSFADFKYENLGDKILITTASTNLKFEMDSQTGRIISFSWGQFSEAKKVLKNNQGGLELYPQQGIMLDSGFTFAQDPTARPNSNSTFVNSRKQTCTFKNKELFRYNTSGDPSYKWTDKETFQLIKSRCPNFQN
jgi:hypothetical protein